MTIWYSGKPITAGRAEGTFYVFSADQIHELDRLWEWLQNKNPVDFNREQCASGLDAIGRRTGRPVIKMHVSLTRLAEKELGAVEVPDGYLPIIYTLLRREYVRKDPRLDVDADPRITKYFRDHLSSQVRQLVLGKLIPGTKKRQPPDAIIDPEELDDLMEDDDPDYVRHVRHRISQIKILNARIDALDLQQRVPVKIKQSPDERAENSYVRGRDQVEEPQEVDPNSSDLPPHMRFAIERGLIKERLD